MKNCPVCQTNPATQHSLYGVLPCVDCKQRRSQNDLPDIQIEFVGNSIKDQRREYARSIVQPYRSGVASKEFMDLYPEKADTYFSKEDKKKADYVWKDTFGSLDLKKTK